MNFFRVPLIGKLVLGGAGSALLGVSLLGAQATTAFAASPSPTATAKQPAKPAAKGDRSDRHLIARAVLTAEAAVLDLKPEDLRKALKDAKTVEQLAAVKGMNKDQFADRLANAVKPELDKLVDAHKLTAEQEARVLARVRAGHIPFWDGIHHKKAA